MQLLVTLTTQVHDMIGCDSSLAVRIHVPPFMKTEIGYNVAGIICSYASLGQKL